MPIVSIQGTSQAIEVKAGEILYDSLFERGVELPHGCLSGSCGACKVEVTLGSEHLLPPGVIEQNTIEAIKDELVKTKGHAFVEGKTIRLSCRAKVLGNVTVKPIK